MPEENPAVARGFDHSAHENELSGEGADRVNRRPFVIALLITATFMVAEIIGGLLTNSLALLADAGHMATDVAALALSLFAIWLARRPATPERSYGFYRAEVLAALINAATLVAISIYIFWEAFNRIGEPPEIDSGPMLVVAFAGLLANAAAAWVLMRGGGHEDNLNARGAFLHVIGDMLGSVGAIVAALVMLATGWYLADPILSAGIGMLILWSSWRLLRESVEVLLESTPKGIDTTEVLRSMNQIDGVAGMHDLHIWTVTSGLVAMSGHVEVTDERDWHDILLELSALLRSDFGIAHVTLQPETAGDESGILQGCSLDSEEGRQACLVPASPAPQLTTGHQGHRH
jgi:cobalt-zinc-cadmium efflux system protein